MMTHAITQDLLEHQCSMERHATEYTCRDDAERIAQGRENVAMLSAALVPSRYVVSARGTRWVIERRARSDWRLLDIL